MPAAHMPRSYNMLTGFSPLQPREPINSRDRSGGALGDERVGSGHFEQSITAILAPLFRVLTGIAVKQRAGERPELCGFPFGDDVPEIRHQLDIVAGEHLIQGPLGPFRLPSPLLALGDFVLVFLHFCSRSVNMAPLHQRRAALDGTLTCAPVRKDGNAVEILQRRTD